MEKQTSSVPEKLSSLQARAIPVLAASRSIRSGADQCAKKKVCSRSTFWGWWKEPLFRSLVEQARVAHQQEIIDEVRELARKDLKKRYDQLERCCRSGGETGQVNAIKLAMLLAGVREFAQGSSVNIGVSANATVQSGEQADNAFIERARAAARARGVVDLPPSEN
jgi:hypothetical protein